MTKATSDTGARGEDLARLFLERKGYTIVETNWSTRYGELDIVARSEDTIVFVEVKTRRAGNTESAFAGITPAKQERLIKAAYQYLHDNDLDDKLWRFDAIGIALSRNQPPIIDHIEDVFDW